VTASAAPGSRTPAGALAVVLLALPVLVPLAVAVVELREPRWFPVFDLAMTEMRVRDVGVEHPPLIGLPGRIGDEANPGSHPGPASFYALAPVHRLLGGSSWALLVSTAAVQAAAVLTALALALRRGPGPAVGVAAVLVAVLQGYGLGLVVEPWNPYLPVLWFVAFLVAAWCTVAGDLPALPVAVAAGSLCAQTHVPYLALTVAVGAAAAVAAAVHARRTRAGSPARRASLRWLAVAAAVGVVLWLPPVVQELRPGRGNLTELVDHFGSPPEPAIGLRRGLDEWLLRLDPWHLLVDETANPGELDGVFHPHAPVRWRGLVALAVWATAAAVAVRRRLARVLALHAVVAVALLAGLLAISRIFGTPWRYLMLWAWSTTALALLAIAWTAVAAAPPRWRASAARLARPATIAVVAVLAALGGRLALDAGDLTTGTPEVTEPLAALVPDTVEALRGGTGPAPGPSGAYLVGWDDAVHGGSQGYGLVNELERLGFDVGVDARLSRPFRSHRVLDEQDADAQVRLASGGWIDRWDDVPGAVEVARVDTRTEAARAELERLGTEVARGYAAAGLPDLAARFELDLFGAGMDPRTPPDLGLKIGRMITLGSPVVVYVAPVGARP
jgi:hypothetical protein